MYENSICEILFLARWIDAYTLQRIKLFLLKYIYSLFNDIFFIIFLIDLNMSFHKKLSTVVSSDVIPFQAITEAVCADKRWDGLSPRVSPATKRARTRLLYHSSSSGSKKKFYLFTFFFLKGNLLFEKQNLNFLKNFAFF